MSGRRMMDAILENARTPFAFDDGDEAPVRLLPPMPAAELERLRKRLPCPMPGDLEELLLWTTGVDQVVEPLRIDPNIKLGPFEDFLPCPLAVAGDGAGNYWVLDLTAASRIAGPVLFLCQDPPALMYHSDTLLEFIEDWFEWQRPPYGGRLDEDRTMPLLQELWAQRRAPKLPRAGDFRDSTDPVLAEFSRTLAPDWHIADLRTRQYGDAFVLWEDWGSRPPVRFGSELLFAIPARERSSSSAIIAKLLEDD